MYRQNQFYEVTGELLMDLIIDDKFKALITLMARCLFLMGKYKKSGNLLFQLKHIVRYNMNQS